MRPFRFGLQVGPLEPGELRAVARRAEEAGFDVVHTADHVGRGWAPLPALLAMAEATDRLRVGPLVLNNDFHHPVHLAREVVAIDRLTEGRVELGLGAGHAFTEYAAIGVPFDPPAVRKARLAESVEAIRRLVDGEEVTTAGPHVRLTGVRIARAHQDRLPILVAVSGPRWLAHAGAHADIVGLFGLGRTLPDGHTHEVRWSPDHLDATVAAVAAGAAGAGRPVPELQALVQVVRVTDDRNGAAAAIAAEVSGLTADDALATPYLALGTHDEMAAHLRACRERWGISYVSVRDLDAFAPVVERLRGT